MTRLTGRARYLSAGAGLTLLAVASCAKAPAEMPATTVTLHQGWHIAAATAVTAEPAAVSTVGFDTAGWTATTVPATVLAALVRSGEIEDPYFGRNLERIPEERFAGPWWYRTEIALDAPLPAVARLAFAGINYRADVWLNGRQVATRDDLVGAFRMFDLDVSAHLVAGENALAVLVHPPRPGDPTIGFVDWNPTPPDRSMGLWRPVELRLTGAVALDEIFVRSDLDPDDLSRAALTVSGTLRNGTDRPLTAVVRGTVGEGIEVEEKLTLGPREERRLELPADRFEQLVIEEPRLWWPNNMGEPELYELAMTVTVDGEISDRREVTFGIRHVEDYLTEEGHRGYRVNGREVLVRGGGWVDDLLLADDDRRLEDQLRYVEHMNLNAIRLEGFWGSSRKLYELADRYGILVLVGWSCQWEWESYFGAPVDEFGGIDSPAEMELVSRSLRDQVAWLRNHPSVLAWVLASDMLPRPELERRYEEALAEVDPTRPALATCAAATSEVSGPSGVKMNGPYQWVPPIYWYLDRERGGAYGFNTETGPGPQPPPADSIRRMLPEESWWPIDEMWEFHSGRGIFGTLDVYREALDARYGPSAGLEEFARKAQAANYEAMRAMFESFSIRRPETTGIVQWMLNSAWPEMYWQLYDHYLVPNGAFYGARDASRPVNIAYDRADRTVVLVNDTDAPLAGVTARVRALDLRSNVLFEESRALDVPAGAILPVLTPPEITIGGAWFLDARLESAGGETLVSSLYWLPAREDVPDWDASEWFYTPTADYADLTGLDALPRVGLAVDHRFEEASGGLTIQVELENPSDKIAFFVELRVVGAESGRLAAPILWSDNYLSLLPGEKRAVRGEIPAHALTGEEPVFQYSGFNVDG